MFGIIYPIFKEGFVMVFLFSEHLYSYSPEAVCLKEVDVVGYSKYWPIKRSEGCTIEVAMRVWRV